MSVPEYVRRKYSTMFSTHPPFAYEHTEDSILARLRCDMPSSMAYKEQPIHSCGAERTRRLSLPAIHRVAVDPVPGTSKLPFPPPRRSLTAPGETVRGDERIASDWPDSPDAVSDHDDWTIVEPIEALNATDKSANKSGVNRCPRCKTKTPRHLTDQTSQTKDCSQPLCTCSDIEKHQDRRVDCLESVQVRRGAW